MISLRKKDMETIRQIAENCFNEPIELLAYGSRVNGDSHDGSDLDLVVRALSLKPVNSEDTNNFREKLQDSTIPILIQVQDWARVPENFKVNILNNYEILFSNIQHSSKAE